MEIVTRKEARQKGLLHYFTGILCSKGHISERLTSGGCCIECGNAHSLAYQQKKLPKASRPRPEICELCGKLPPKGRKKLHLDHDHKTNLFRGWLCSVCNMSLGRFGDSIEGLQKAIDYLVKNGGEVEKQKTKSLLPTDAAERKKVPLASGVFDYFPQALIEVAKISQAGNDQHNPGEPLHWSRGKSADHSDTMLRHFAERGSLDTDGKRHSAKMVWRALAILQLELEAEGYPVARGAK